VEINSTFYRPPGNLQVNAWIKKGKDKKGYEYSVKVPQLVSHKALVQGGGSQVASCRVFISK
jgi:uncharacterized protein YecE (DUF72 family)